MLSELNAQSKDFSELITRIKAHLSAGGQVMVCTYTRAVVYNKRHVEMFRVGRDGSPLVQRGKHWDDFRGAAVRFSK